MVGGMVRWSVTSLVDASCNKIQRLFSHSIHWDVLLNKKSVEKEQLGQAADVSEAKEKQKRIADEQ